MITIGLTGSIAAGKSEVSRRLAALGARVVDADIEAHAVYAPGQPGHQQLVDAFGVDILDDNGAIDRRRLGTLVFANPEQLSRLSSIIWPLTRQRIERLKQQAQEDDVAVFVIEAPLLVEAGWNDLVDRIWFVEAAPSVALERLRQRGLTNEQAQARMAARTGIDAAKAAADVIIDNSGSLSELNHRLEGLWQMLRDEAI